MKNQVYITDDERKKCQKVADAFTELFKQDDVLVLDAGKYGFVKLQYFKFPFCIDTAEIFFDSESLFDDLWRNWLDTHLLNLSIGTPMEEMTYADILKCLPKEKLRELLDIRLHFAKKTGIDGILEKRKDSLLKENSMNISKE